MAKEDYYDTLGVARGADADALKQAYRKLAMQYHPDRNPGDTGAEQKFKQINEAYDVLKDDQKRAAYDRFGHAAFEGGAPGAQPARRLRFRLRLRRHFRRDVRRLHGRQARHPHARRRPSLQHGDLSRGGLQRQRDEDQDSGLGYLRHVRRLRRGAGQRADKLHRLPRAGQGPGPAGLLHHRAHLPQLPGRGSGDRESVPELRRHRPHAARKDPRGHDPAGRRGRDPHPPRRRRRGRHARVEPRRSLHFRIGQRSTACSNGTGPRCSAACRSR